MARSGQSSPLSMVEMLRPVVGLAATYGDRARIPPHRHPVAQLIHAERGVMTVTTDAGTWVVPPQRAVWVPPDVVHAIRMTGAVEMRTLYVDPRLDALPPWCGVVHVSPLLRELVLRAVAFVQPYPGDGPEARLAAVLLDQIRAAPVAPLHLPLPRDPRTLRVARALLDDPADRRSLTGWARPAAASSRTLARLFRSETGMSFRAWRQQLRLLRALERLAGGEAVTSVALDVGFESPSAFVAMFRRALGVPPGRYFADRRRSAATPAGGRRARSGRA